MYIHEHPHWPQFTWDEKSIGTQLAHVRYAQGRLLGLLESLGFELKQEADLLMLTQSVLKTSEIEGESLSREEVRSSIARRLGVPLLGVPVTPSRSVEASVAVTLDATQDFKKPLTAERLYGWHAALFPTGYSGLSPIRVGQWRDDAQGPMEVVSGPLGRERVHYQAPAASKLEEEMASFLAWYNEPSGDWILKSAMAHLWFVTLHPFEDGNGRIARAIGDMALARSDQSPHRFYSMSAEIQKNRSAYYTMLEQTQAGTLQITSWMQWYLSCLALSIDHAQEQLSVVLTKEVFWRNASKLDLNERQQLVLNRLMDGFEGHLTTSKWAKLAKCSQDTALRDIQGLMQKGLLRPGEGGGRSVHYRLVIAYRN